MADYMLKLPPQLTENEAVEIIDYVLARTTQTVKKNIIVRLTDNKPEKLAENYIKTFAQEILPKCVWDIIPYQFLYDLYLVWMSIHHKRMKPSGKRQFIKDLQSLIQKDTDFSNWTLTETPVHPGHRMDSPEYLIHEFKLTKWANTRKKCVSLDDYCRTPLKTSYHGLLRK